MKGWIVRASDLQAATTTAQAAADAAAAAAAAAQSDADASLKSAQNLGDLGSASVARNNLGANQVFLETRFDDIRAATGQVRYLAWPLAVGGFAIKLIVTLEGALATGDAEIAVAIDGVATSPASLTLVEAGSAAASRFTATFVGANAISANATIALTCGGANTAAVGASVEFVAIF